MSEIWKDIKGYERYYQVSTYGNVRSLTRTVCLSGKRQGVKLLKKGKQLIVCVNQNGYPYVSLSKHGKTKHGVIHQLVSNAFIDNPFKKKYINHKDGNKLNRHMSNFEWVTHQENMDHAWSNGLMRVGEDSATAKLSNVQVIEIKNLYVKGSIDYSLAKLAKKYNCSKSQIYRIVKGESRKYDK